MGQLIVTNNSKNFKKIKWKEIAPTKTFSRLRHVFLPNECSWGRNAWRSLLNVWVVHVARQTWRSHVSSKSGATRVFRQLSYFTPILYTTRSLSESEARRKEAAFSQFVIVDQQTQIYLMLAMGFQPWTDLAFAHWTVFHYLSLRPRRTVTTL